jgi:hypothetical protein
MQTKTRAEQEVRELVRWRSTRLAQAGFPPQLADRVANDPRYDLHALIELVERGCQPELAVRILTPLDEGQSAS